MYCTNCGQRRNGNETHCSFCGKEFPKLQNQSDSTANTNTNQQINTQQTQNQQPPPPFAGGGGASPNPMYGQNTWQNQTPRPNVPSGQSYQFGSFNQQQTKRVCKNCATEVDEGDPRTSCPFCGMHLPHNTPTANPYGASNPNYVAGAGWTPTNQEPASGRVNTLNMVLAIVNLLSLFCCQIVPLVLGIIALVNTLAAPKKSTKAEEDSLNKLSLILNIIGLVFNVIAVFSVLFFFL